MKDLFGAAEPAEEKKAADKKGTTKRIMVPLGEVIHRPFSVTYVSKTERIIWNEGPGRVLDRFGR